MSEEKDDALVPEDFSTKPSVNIKNINSQKLHQIPIRIHPRDYELLKVMLKKDELSFQKFINFCVRGYMRGDPTMLKAIKMERELDLFPAEVKEKHVLSHRERAEIYNELEKGE